MAGLNLSGNWDSVTLNTGAYRTVCTVKAPTNQMVRVKSAWVCANGVAGDAEPLQVHLARVQAGTGTGTTVTAQKLNNALTCTPQATVKVDFTAGEPTLDGTLPYIYPHNIHPQGSSTKECSFDDCYIKEGTELAVRVKVPSGGTAVKCSGHVIFEE